jgi:acetyltransferase
LSAAARFQGYKKSKAADHKAVCSSVDSESVKAVVSLPRAGVLDEYESKKILKNWGMPVVDERIITTLSAAKSAVAEMDFPVVLKGLIPGLVHKTEQGLVKLGIAGREDLEMTFRDMEKKLGGQGKILIQQQIRKDFELITGFLRDAQFGPCVMFGLGGIFSELRPDVRFALAPVKHSEAVKLIGRIKGEKILKGFRGITPLNVEAMAEFIVRLGRLGAENPGIEQIDVNPVVITAGRPVAVDATIVLS